jgi:hypothetical protein
MPYRAFIGWFAFIPTSRRMGYSAHILIKSLMAIIVPPSATNSSLAAKVTLAIALSGCCKIFDLHIV